MATSFCLKIVTDEVLRDGKKLPEPAVRKYGKCMTNSIFLKIPNYGTSWPIELKKMICGSRIWCQKGWKEFADFYSIDEDYFVMFSYEGEHSHFQVHIFHCNNMKIDYPILGGGEHSHFQVRIFHCNNIKIDYPILGGVENVYLEMGMLAFIAEHYKVIFVYGVKVCKFLPSLLTPNSTTTNRFFQFYWP